MTSTVLHFGTYSIWRSVGILYNHSQLPGPVPLSCLFSFPQRHMVPLESSYLEGYKTTGAWNTFGNFSKSALKS